MQKRIHRSYLFLQAKLLAVFHLKTVNEIYIGRARQRRSDSPLYRTSIDFIPMEHQKKNIGEDIKFSSQIDAGHGQNLTSVSVPGKKSAGIKRSSSKGPR